MSHKFNLKILICMFTFILGFIFFSSKVSATYKFCDTKIEGTTYYDCGNYIYTYYEDTRHSTIIYALDDANIIYVGEKEGVSIFYADGFRYYNVSYDDRESSDENLWSVLSSKGKIIYDGTFSDSKYIDDSHEGFYYYGLYADVYAIKQYKKGELYRTIAIYNIDNDVDFIKATYDDIEIFENTLNEVPQAEEEIKVSIDSLYGVKSLKTIINGSEVESKITNNVVHISSEVINPLLVAGEEVIFTIEIEDYFNNTYICDYSLKLFKDIVSIRFSTMTSVTQSVSRRIVIDATAGKDKELDLGYCWYYWSTSPDDSLKYDDFLVNYGNSNYKGSYSEDKGVILRNTTGTYYLYALAKDNDSWVVEKSEGFVLNHLNTTVSYTIGDVILVVSLLIAAIVPIYIYLIIRKKGY